MSRSPTLADVLRGSMTSMLCRTHTALPAEVLAYDNTTQTVDVRPVIRQAELDPNNNLNISELPDILQVPVVFPRVKGFFLSFPITPGDTVLLVICESDIDRWQERGTADGLNDPEDVRRHDLSDAVAIPGLFAEPDALQNVDPADEGMMLGSDAANGARIYIADGIIELGQKGSADRVSLDSAVQAELTALRNTVDSLVTAYNSHVHPYVDTGGAPGAVTGPTPSAGTNPAAVGTTASTLVTIKE